MIQSATLIILHTQRYKESSLLVYAYSNVYGRQNYLVKGVRSPKNKAKASCFHPLSILEAETYNNPKKELQQLKEYHKVFPLENLFLDVAKSTTALFMGELLYKCLRETETDPALFDFVYQTVVELDNAPEHDPNTPIRFASQLCRYLGYEPHDNYHPQDAPFFHIASASFFPTPDLIQDAFDTDSSFLLHALLAKVPFTTTGAKRHAFLTRLLAFYAYHMGKPITLQSPDILHSIFR